MPDSLHKNTILCLINSAAFARTYFEKLAPHLRSLGYKVHFALDSHLNDYLYAGGKPLDSAYYFTDYLKDHPAKDIELRKFGTTWRTLFSDFDRWVTFDLDPPVQTYGGFQYQNIPAQLDMFFGKIFNELHPSAVLYEPVSNSFAYSAYRTCQAWRIPFLSLGSSRIPGRIELSTSGGLNDYESIQSIHKKYVYSGIPPEILKETLKYTASIDDAIPDYIKMNGLDKVSLIEKYFHLEKIKHFLRIWFYSKTQHVDLSLAYQHGNPVDLSLAYVRRAIWRKIRLSKVRQLLEAHIPDEDFLLYPLHFHPEASTSIMAADYVDELSLIRALAFRLPTHVKLYVKEHPSAVALQPLWFYKQLSRLPNIRLLSPDLNAKTLIRKSRGIVTLTSTAGFEGAVLNKPVLAFGNVFYRYFPNVKTVKGYDDIEEKLAWLFSYEPLSATDITCATAAYLSFGFPGNFDHMETMCSKTALADIAQLIKATLLKTNEKDRI